MSTLLPLVVIVGPTAVGKTFVGIELAKRIAGEVISGDSMQVYKHLNIGTAKPSREEINGIPHYMIDIANPDEEFNVAIFQKQVEYYVKFINDRKKLPVLVGGTGLYVRSVIDHYDFSPPGENPDKRAELLELVRLKGNEFLVELLTKNDPVAAARIHPNDTRRLIRALEVFYTTGRPISDFQYNSVKKISKYNLAYFGLNMNRQDLYKRIEQRVDIMISRGLVDEVKSLLEMGYGLHNPSMQALGYKELVDYLNNVCSLEEAVETIKRNTRRFAKRQLTWFRRDERIRWKDVEKYSSLMEIADEIVMEVEGQFSIT